MGSRYIVWILKDTLEKCANSLTSGKSNKIRLFAVLAVLGAWTHPWRYLTLLSLLFVPVWAFHKVVLKLLVVVTIAHAKVIGVLHVLHLTILVHMGRCLVMSRICVSHFVAMPHATGRDIRALPMRIEVIIVTIAVSISMGWVLELTDDILLISSCIARSHLVLVLVHHLLHQVVLAVLAFCHIVSIEALTGVLDLMASISGLHDVVLP